MKQVIYVINEVERTRGEKSNIDRNIVRDYKGDGKSFTAVSLSQPDVPTFIVTDNNKYEYVEIPADNGNRTFMGKTSTAIRVAMNLYKRGINFSFIHYSKKGKVVTTVDAFKDNLYEKIDAFCGLEPKEKVNKFGFKDKNGNIVDEFRKTTEERPQITMKSFYSIGENPYKIFKNEESFEKNLQIFTKYAEVYGLDHKNPVDMLTFLYIQQHREIAEDYMDGTKFICPCCHSVVTVNGYERFIKGKLVNTGKTVCETCYTAYKVHDKKDVLRLARYVAKQK